MSGTNAWAAELILVAGPWTASRFYPAGTQVLSSIDLPTWTTAARPSAPNIGRMGLNTTLGLLEQWNGSAWQQYNIANLSTPPPIGNTTPNSGAFTTLSATSTISGAGFTAWAASPPAIGGTAPAAGAFTTLSASGNFSGAAGSFSGALTPSQTNGIVGTTTNNNASAGSVGEFVSSVVASGSAVALSNNVSKDITTISLTAGDWDVWGTTNFTASVGVTAFSGWINTTSITQPVTPNGAVVVTTLSSGSFTSTHGFPVGNARLSLSGTTTVYLSIAAAFASGTCSAFGFIGARRRR